MGEMGETGAHPAPPVQAQSEPKDIGASTRDSHPSAEWPRAVSFDEVSEHVRTRASNPRPLLLLSR